MDLWSDSFYRLTGYCCNKSTPSVARGARVETIPVVVGHLVAVGLGLLAINKTPTVGVLFMASKPKPTATISIAGHHCPLSNASLCCSVSDACM